MDCYYIAVLCVVSARLFSLFLLTQKMEFLVKSENHVHVPCLTLLVQMTLLAHIMVIFEGFDYKHTFVCWFIPLFS